MLHFFRLYYTMFKLVSISAYILDVMLANFYCLRRLTCCCLVIIYLMGCEAALKEAPPAAARETLPTVATKLESTAHCGTVPVPPITGPPEMS